MTVWKSSHKKLTFDNARVGTYFVSVASGMSYIIIDKGEFLVIYQPYNLDDLGLDHSYSLNREELYSYNLAIQDLISP